MSKFLSGVQFALALVLFILVLFAHLDQSESSTVSAAQKSPKCIDIDTVCSCKASKVAKCLHYGGGRACYKKYNVCEPGSK